MGRCGRATQAVRSVKYRVTIRPRAEADLQEAKRHYEERRTGLGEELIVIVRQAVRYLELYPERRLIYYRDFRRFLLRRFPYKIFYRIEGDRVIVFRILHVKQDHPRWL